MLYIFLVRKYCGSQSDAELFTHDSCYSTSQGFTYCICSTMNCNKYQNLTVDRTSSQHNSVSTTSMQKTSAVPPTTTSLSTSTHTNLGPTKLKTAAAPTFSLSHHPTLPYHKLELWRRCVGFDNTTNISNSTSNRDIRKTLMITVLILLILNVCK